jgi:hypothetical protein
VIIHTVPQSDVKKWRNSVRFVPIASECCTLRIWAFALLTETRVKSLIFNIFYARQLSRVDDRGSANLVPLFAAHHIECVQLGWAISHPFCFCQNKYFLRKFGDENTSRNITYRDQFSRVATSNTVVRLTDHRRMNPKL